MKALEVNEYVQSHMAWLESLETVQGVSDNGIFYTSSKEPVEPTPFEEESD